MDSVVFGKHFRKQHFLLDADAVCLNNGSYGAVPKRVFNFQTRLREEMEHHPDTWYRRHNPQYHLRSLRVLCDIIGAKVENTIFVENATTGLDAVLKSLTLTAGDAVMTTSLTYHSVLVMCKEKCQSATGIQLINLEIKFPIKSKEDIIRQFSDCLDENPNIKVAIIDHVTSPSSIVLPVKEMSVLCHEKNVLAMVDGAHAAGQIPLNVEGLDVDFYAGNLHKWMFTPRGCAYLWVHPHHQRALRPGIVSHFHGVKMHYDFVVRGTRDDTPYHTIAEAWRFCTDVGGLDAIAAYNSTMLEKAVCYLEDSWGTERLQVHAELEAPFMKLIRLPEMPQYAQTSIGAGDVEEDLYRRFNIQVLCMLVQNQIYVRISGQIYNYGEEYVKLGDAVLQLKKEGRRGALDKGYSLPIMHWDLRPLTF